MKNNNRILVYANFVFSLFIKKANELLVLSPTRKNLSFEIEKSNKAILDYLINIRLLSFAFLTSPILSIIPFAISGNKQLGLMNFAVGTLSIIAFLYLFKNIRSDIDPLKLIRFGGISALILNVFTAIFLIFAIKIGLSKEYFVTIYIFFQIFAGIPFSLISGVDSKLSRSIYRKIRTNNQENFSPNAEFRKIKNFGSTLATTIGALIWCLVIFANPNAPFNPEWYSIIFILNIVPNLALLINLGRLEQKILAISENYATDDKQKPVKSLEMEEKKNFQNSFPQKTLESVISIGCLEGILQFAQFYFSISAIKNLFEGVKDLQILILLIPILFFFVNHIEQIGSGLFSRFIPYLKKLSDLNNTNHLKRRQYMALTIIFVAAIIFVLHVFILNNFVWNTVLDLFAYALFNIIKGFAGGLTEEWNESLAQDSTHDEALFSTYNSLIGRIYQVASIIFYPVITQFISNDHWTKMLEFKSPEKEFFSIGAALTIALFGLIAANILAFMWLGYTESTEHSTLQTIIESLTKPEKRLALFTQLLRTFFIVFLILSNLLSLKIFEVKGIEFTHGSIFYISSFVILHLIATFEGIEVATKTVLQGIVTYLLLFTCLTLSGNLAGKLETYIVSLETYNKILTALGYLFLASFAGYASVIILNILLMTILLKYFAIKKSLLITALVTFITQLLDTIIFVNIGFQDMEGNRLSLFFGQFTVKFSVYLVMYFPLYYIIYFLKKFLRFDYLVKS